MMACAEPPMSQERGLFDAFERAERYRLDEDGALVIEDGGGARLIVAHR
mgnify:FL=1